MERHNPSLIICILLDIVGISSLAIPGFGEYSDLIGAPLLGYLFSKIFSDRKGIAGGLVTFTKELIPFTDFFPTFSIMWIWLNYTRKKSGNIFAAEANNEVLQ